MKRLTILASFETEINKLDDAVNKPVTDDSLYWLNQAVRKFIKERFNGNAPHYTSYEQNEKRTRDLHKLYNRVKVDLLNDEDMSMLWPERSSFRSTLYLWPEDVMYILNEDVTIVDNNDENEYETSVFECTADNFMYRVTNGLTDFHYKHHKARPLRVRIGKSDDQYAVALLDDGNYQIKNYWISYLKEPEKLTSDDPDNTDVEYNDFEDDVWFEIIKIAAQMYIENQKDSRYQTLTNEVLTQE